MAHCMLRKMATEIGSKRNERGGLTRQEKLEVERLVMLQAFFALYPPSRDGHSVAFRNRTQSMITVQSKL